MFESNGNAAEGNISAILINRNASSYSPAVTDTQGQAFQKTELVEQQAKSAELETATTQENRFKDVTKLGIDPSILPSMRRLN